MNLLTVLALILTSCTAVIAGGMSYKIKIVSFEESQPDRYTMTFQRIVEDSQQQQPEVTLRLRHNEHYYSKIDAPLYTKDTYHQAILNLQSHFKKGEVFSLGAMGGAWGIPVKDTENEYWVQTVANIEEDNGTKVVYTFKE
ncbi:hypothetical protein [Luteolibacter sp. AS25]|uniref:hypothetical protein n=1 Tax=Luteolibacter sp. AS25 TaxID=3135776 RepID=UPI00398ACEE5